MKNSKITIDVKTNAKSVANDLKDLEAIIDRLKEKGITFVSTYIRNK
jgi:hypothetical protein